MSSKTLKGIGFDTALYHFGCVECGDEVEWVADFDADGTTYRADCCDHMYFMIPETVEVMVSDDED